MPETGIILVVEDNDINVEIIENILQKTYAKVTCAKTAEEAIQLIEASGEFEYDLILMDIQLRGWMVTAARSIRSMDRADAIVTSCFGDDGRCSDAGRIRHWWHECTYSSRL